MTARSDFLKLLALLIVTRLVDYETADAIANDDIVCMSLDGGIGYLIESLGLQIPVQNEVVSMDGPNRSAMMAEAMEQAAQMTTELTPPVWLLLAYEQWFRLQQAGVLAVEPPPQESP